MQGENTTVKMALVPSLISSAAWYYDDTESIRTYSELLEILEEPSWLTIFSGNVVSKNSFYQH